MWQPTQYYHTKMQLTRMELEQKLQIGIGGKKKKEKTDSEPIIEKMHMPEVTDASENELDLLPAAEVVESETFKKKKKKRKLKKQEAESEEQETEENKGLVTEQKTQLSAESDDGSADQMIFSSEQLQERVLWAEILGEPVSVRRRKKRMEQLYGNQGNAYRR